MSSAMALSSRALYRALQASNSHISQDILLLNCGCTSSCCSASSNTWFGLRVWKHCKSEQRFILGRWASTRLVT
eukprot:3326729-Amphidinium_carterae.1